MPARPLTLVRDVARHVAWALARSLGFLAVVVIVYQVLHREGIWYPNPVSDYWATALITAVSIAFGRRLPLVHLLVVGAAVANPFWVFYPADVRAIPLVLAAYLTANAGLRAGVALPIAGVAALLGQYNGWLVNVDAGFFRYWLQQWGFSEQLLIVGITIAATLVGRASFLQRRTADSLRAQNDELARLRESDRERIAGEERTAIAREVHDVVAHHVAAIVVRAQAAARVADRNPDDPRRAVEWIAEAGPQALTEMRGLVRVLRDDSATGPHAPVTLAGELGTVIERVRTAGLDVHDHIEAPGGLTAVQEFAMLRVCQEALTNVLVHSPATAVELRLYRAGDDAVLVVEDNGALVTPSAGDERRSDASSDGGSGIRGMRERAKAAGGIVTAGPSPVGWRVELVLPRGEAVRAVPRLGEAASA